MSRLLCLTLLALLGPVLFAGCGQSSSPVYRVAPGDRILAFGDSLTRGMGAPRGASYPEQLAALTGWEVVAAGVNGETTEQGRERLPAVLREHRPDVVLLCLGGNDFLRRQSLERTQTNLVQMIDEIRAIGAQPILVAVPEPALLGMDDHPLYAQVAKQTSVPLIADVMNDTLKVAKWRSDRIHPNAAGYANIAQKIATALGHRR